MRIITKYVADDGLQFDTEKECSDHEKSISKRKIGAINFNDHDDTRIELYITPIDKSFYVIVTQGDYRSWGSVFEGSLTDYIKRDSSCLGKVMQYISHKFYDAKFKD